MLLFIPDLQFGSYIQEEQSPEINYKQVGAARCEYAFQWK